MNCRLNDTIKDFQENFPVGGNADVFFIDVVIQKHSGWVLPRLFPETNPGPNGYNQQWFQGECRALVLLIIILPVNAEVELALLLQQRKQLLFGLSNGHALGKHRVHQELARLKMTKIT